MQTYKKRPVNASSVGAEPQQSAQLPMGGGSLTDGASRLDLPDAMRAKMENAFGADLSGVKFYQSENVAEGGANAVTMGNAVAFAPGKFDMSSQSGQALLGHELSHVVSQQRGEVRGQGLLNDYALEARADREGALAAAGQQVYAGPVTPLSTSSASTMAGPMQCKKDAQQDSPKSNKIDLLYNDPSPKIYRDPKKSKFSFEEWLVHNFRRRGYRKGVDARGQEDYAQANAPVPEEDEFDDL